MASLRRLLALALGLGLTASQSIKPIESRGALQVGSPLYTLAIEPELPSQPSPENLHLYPATQILNAPDETLKGLHISGRLVSVGPGNANKLKAGDIAYLSCDPDDYPGIIDPEETLEIIFNATTRPAAILLYTTHAVRCDFSPDPDDRPKATYKTIFSLRDPELANALLTSHLRHAATISTSGPVTTAQALQEDPQPPKSTMGDTRGNGVETTRNTAMIILYTVTGVITVLFLAVIMTGAIRAHRHPDRYGPRNLPGRSRQSRAKGIARAMLDTLPIVKFGEDRERTKHDGQDGEGERDIEMAAGQAHTPDHAHQHTHEHTHEHTSTEQVEGTTTTGIADVTPSQRSRSVSPSASAAASSSSSGAASLPSEREPSTTCPICTDEFVRGQDVRILPCNHSFHPECVDPWLVDVSGTCPLCKLACYDRDRHPATQRRDGGTGFLHYSLNASASGPEGTARVREARSHILGSSPVF
ncbi:RING-7 protein [Arthroderma uncinatum]|uniref:RING-7 protein n=1 Tax=Arthroderma uncinatum TaxID=74035 RepID=UPI00144AC3F1|nr:RING-7 protein [Arthroderma uncinatum]KAF3484200.1 RING-7 protein [Arthroderma uncinatum]